MNKEVVSFDPLMNLDKKGDLIKKKSNKLVIKK